MRRICLIIHCEASHSVDGKVGGWFDSTLTLNGEKQATLLSKRITDYGFNIDDSIAYSSDLLRAVQTAKILLKDSTANLNLDNRLREMSFGTHEGMEQGEHNKIMMPISPIGERLDHGICNGSETRRDVATRISEFVEEIMKTNDDKIVVTHGFAATFFIAAFQKIDIECMGYMNFKFNPGSVSILEEDDLFNNRSVNLLNG